MTPFAFAMERPAAPSRNVEDDEDEDQAEETLAGDDGFASIPIKILSSSSTVSQDYLSAFQDPAVYFESIIICSTETSQFTELLFDPSSDIHQKIKRSKPDAIIGREIEIFASSSKPSSVVVIRFNEAVQPIADSAKIAQYLFDAKGIIVKGGKPPKFVYAFTTALDMTTYAGPSVRLIQTFAMEKAYSKPFELFKIKKLESTKRVDGFVAAVLSECQYQQIPAAAFVSMRESRVGRENIQILESCTRSIGLMLKSCDALKKEGILHPYLVEISSLSDEAATKNQASFKNAIKGIRMKDKDDFLMFL